MRKTLALPLCIILSLFAISQPGTIDASFGNAGRVIVATGEEGDINAANDVIIQPDGKILTVGSAISSVQIFGITRHLSDGSLDNTFSDDGIAYINSFATSDSHSEAYGIALQADGKIVVVGEYSEFVRRQQEFYSIVIRLNTDGTLDETFNGTGYLLLKLSDPNVNERLWGVAIQPDGKIVANGTSREIDFSDQPHMTVVRINSDGTLDPSFGTGGIVRIDNTHTSEGTRVVLQADNKIVTVGSILIEEENDFLVTRLNTNGTLDNTLDADGMVIIDFGGNNFGQGVKVSPTGNIVVAGYVSLPGNVDIAVARLLPNGSFDNTFDGDGKKLIDHSPEDIAQSLAIQLDDTKLLICGSSLEESGPVTTTKLKVTRLNNDGSLDLSFAGDGSYEDDFGSAAFALGCALQTDGKLVVAGFGNDGEVSGRALTRINLQHDCNANPITGTFNDFNAFPVGVQPNTLYYGFLPTSFAMIRVNAGGGLPFSSGYQFTWSSSSTNASFMVVPMNPSMIIVTATGGGTASFTVKIKDSLGCEKTFAKTITIIDVRCGSKMNKVIVCNPRRNTTSCVNQGDVLGLLIFNGYNLGPCGVGTRSMPTDNVSAETVEQLQLKVLNNPTSNQFTLIFNSDNKTDRITMRIIDQFGVTVERRERINPGQSLQIGANYRKGYYFVEITQNGKTTTAKLLKR